MRVVTSLSYHVKHSASDIATFPKVGSGIAKVWLRNFYYFKSAWMVTAFWAIFEPVLYLFAIGLGLGQFIGQIEGVPYFEWFFPSLLASTAMMVSFFETTYGSFTKLTHQKTYAAILMTPISSEEIVIGEILWATTKAMIGVLGVVVVGAFMGLVTDISIFPSIAVLLLLSFVFASLGMLITSFATHYDSFIYAQSGFIMPMALFSGTYFPIEQLPHWALPVAFVLPLTHGVLAVRSIYLGTPNEFWLINISILAVTGILVANWSAARIHRKLIY